MFKIVNNKGFHITFANGWTASVQFGPGNYCDNYSNTFSLSLPPQKSNTAEIACWGPDGKMVDFFDSGDAVEGHQTTNQVLEFLNKVASQGL